MVTRVVDIIHSYSKNGDYDRAVVASVGIVQLRIMVFMASSRYFIYATRFYPIPLSQIDEQDYLPCDIDLYPG